MDRFFKSLQHAWQGSGQTCVVSRSIYEFKIDERILRITDDDFIFTSRDSTEIPEALFSGRIILKNIRKTATNIQLSIAVPPKTFSKNSAFKGTPAPSVEVRTIPNNSEELIAVEMGIELENAFAPGDRYHIRLTYDVPLDLRNNVLIFAGAIQPADYDGTRRMFGAEFAEKFIAICIASKQRLKAYFYFPRFMDYSPDPKISEKKGDGFEIIEVLPSEMKDWHRAHYFSVFTSLEAEENNSRQS